MTASALKTFRRNWIHRGGNDVSGKSRINEYVIPYRNAISANASLGRCSSNALSQGYASLTLGCLTLAALSGLV